MLVVGQLRGKRNKTQNFFTPMGRKNKKKDLKIIEPIAIDDSPKIETAEW